MTKYSIMKTFPKRTLNHLLPWALIAALLLAVSTEPVGVSLLMLVQVRGQPLTLLFVALALLLSLPVVLFNVSLIVAVLLLDLAVVSLDICQRHIRRIQLLLVLSNL